MLAEGMEGQILFMSLKCTQTKKRLPQSLRSAARSENEGKIESQDSRFFFFLLFVAQYQSYIQVNFISPQSAFVQRSLKRQREERHTAMKAKCINSPPILLLCCDRLSNMQAHFLCQRLDGGSQERTPWVSLSLPRSPQPFKLKCKKNTIFLIFPRDPDFTRNHPPQSARVHPSPHRLPASACVPSSRYRIN